MRAYLLVERVQQQPGLIGDRPGPQRGIGGEPHRGVEPVRERKLVRHAVVLEAAPEKYSTSISFITSARAELALAADFEFTPLSPSHRASHRRRSPRLTPTRTAHRREEAVIHTMGKSAATPRHRPNVLITGTPGTGKSSLAERVAAAVDDLTRIDVSQLAKDGDMLESFDATHDTHVIDEDKVLDHMEEHGLGGDAGGVVVDYHGCDLFPERWFDLVVVLTCDNGVLYDRLQARGYSDTKIRGNVECEIFQTLVEEAKESYDEDIVKVCASDSIEDMEENEKSICEFIRNWKSKTES